MAKQRKQPRFSFQMEIFNEYNAIKTIVFNVSCHTLLSVKKKKNKKKRKKMNEKQTNKRTLERNCQQML